MTSNAAQLKALGKGSGVFALTSIVSHTLNTFEKPAFSIDNNNNKTKKPVSGSTKELA